MAASSGADQVAKVLEQLDQADSSATLVVGRQKVDVTSLDKPLWPDAGPPATKRVLLRYLAEASPWLLPHLKDRPVFVTRAPEGVEGKKFFQKKFPDAPDFVKSLPVYIPAAKKASILANTKLAGGGETVEVTFTAPTEPGEYTYICSFPGHVSGGMKGTLTVR